MCYWAICQVLLPVIWGQLAVIIITTGIIWSIIIGDIVTYGIPVDSFFLQRVYVFHGQDILHSYHRAVYRDSSSYLIHIPYCS